MPDSFDTHVITLEIEVRPREGDEPIRTATRWVSRLMHTTGVWKVKIKSAEEAP